MMATHALPAAGDLHVTVGPMRRRHLRAVLRIEAQVQPRPWSLGLFLSELGYRQSRVYVVARVEGAVVGYGGLMLVGEDAHVTTLAVDPRCRRRQIGSRLLLVLARAALQRGARNLTLEVRVGNEAARALYSSFGFVPAGVRKGYYAETGEDALVMWATDVDRPGYLARLEGIEAGIAGTTSVEELHR
jgi:ribosomal-protein-alanine N-acetyltransferase